jgi:hypothetical protein
MSGRGWASLSGAGLFAGAAAWALHQQTGVIIASWACGEAASGIWIGGAIAGLLLLAGAAMSGLGLRGAWVGAPEHIARPRRFLAIVALMASALFLFALLLQVAASFFLPGCLG